MFKKVYSTKINVIANFAGSIWIAFLSIIFVPFYLRYIGIESYGLIGIFTSIQAFIVLLDFGLSPTLNRELARLSTVEDNAQVMHDLKRTLEIPNWICAVSIALLLSALAPLIARYWIQPKDLSTETVMQALIIMSVNIAILFSVNFYTGGLMGLQKQLLLSFINIICGTLRSVGAFLVLAFVSPTIQAFLLWQGSVALLQVVLMAVTLEKSLPTSSGKGHFQKDSLRKIWRFAAGMTGITIVSLILTQTDKVILSGMLNLEEFGYYTLAVTISSMAIGMVVISINHAVYPQFSRLVSFGDETALREFYHHSCQIMSVFVFPIMIVLALFSYDIVLIYIGKEEIAVNTYILLSLVAVGNGLNSLLWLPYSLQLAHGWTKLAFYINLVMIFFLVPLTVFGVYQYGAVGGATAWVILNVSYFFTSIQMMHRRILKGEQWKWYFEDLALPFVVAISVAGIGKILLPVGGTRFETIITILTISAITFLFTAFSTKATRHYLRNFRSMLLHYAGRNKQILKNE
jgi:O-antigen/teichoic acid export membrane protein